MQTLYTDSGERLTGVPWNRYPRPQLRRADWLCLNGRWSFSSGEKTGAIRVPFPVESSLSGAESVKIGEKMVYSRRFELPEVWHGKRILLHFGAVMRSCRVLVNGSPAAEHDEGYLPFTCDITDLVRAENELTVEVVNDLDFRHPWGKQRVKRGGMWYTPCSGIWQTVWLEPVPEKYVRGFEIRTGRDGVELLFDGADSGEVIFKGEKYPISGGKCAFSVSDPRLWSPEDPYLYDFSVSAGEDSFTSYFALRTLTTETVNGKPRLCLNGKPYYFNALLDQGYWSDGLYTPASPELFEEDILKMKSLGFNTLRKHIKIEPERFYYDCDRLGMIVFQDMVNSGRYYYLTETALPTLHFQKRSDLNRHRDREQRRIFSETMAETVKLLRNHPSICLWTIFNEGWGQFRSDDAYLQLKALDPTRFIDSTSGWFHQKHSDVDSLHIYFDPLHLGQKALPQLLSEFGGWSLKIPEHSFNLEKTYGYRKYEDPEAFRRELREFFRSELLPLVEKGLCGSVYTQVSDVEDETNGILTYDRKVMKLKPEDLSDLAEEMQKAVRQ